MHEINLGIIDVPLPAIVACPTASKGVECYLADETNDLGFAGSNGFQCPFYTRLLLALFQLCHVSCRPVHETYEIQCVLDRKSTRLNSSHLGISYAVFCL